MKIWIKLLIGIAIGVLLALLVKGETALATFDSISVIVINIGRYVLFPLILFSAAIGVYELRREKKVLAALGRTFLYLGVTSVLLAGIGTLSTVILSPDRIPIVIEEEIAYSVPTLSEVLTTLFPRNLFLILGNSGDYLLPLLVFAILIGINLNFDRLSTRPAIQLFDSLSRVFYNMNAFLLEIMALGFIPLTAAFVMRMMATPELALYRQLILLLFIDSLIVVLVIYPLLLYFVAKKKRPFLWLYASMANVLFAAVSGDAYFSLASEIRHGKENYGVGRKIGAVTYPLFTLFGKAGTAMVTGASFILIITSYSSMGITFGQTLWVVLFSFLASLVVGPFPGVGVFVALSLLSAGFSSGYEEGYLILRPLLPVLMSFSVVLDVLTASLSTMLVAQRMDMRKEIDVGEFV